MSNIAIDDGDIDKFVEDAIKPQSQPETNTGLSPPKNPPKPRAKPRARPLNHKQRNPAISTEISPESRPDISNLPIDEQNKIKHMEDQIESYRSSKVFAVELHDIDFNNKDRKALLAMIEARVSGSLSLDYMQAVLIVFQQLEVFINSRTDNMMVGLAKNLYDDFNVRKNIELLKIKYMTSYSEYVQLSPEYCLVISIAYVSIKTFMQNKAKPQELNYE